ncbi:MAG: acyl-protein synthetase [Gemmatimonadetes bacterium]|nr:acyl-protein synthetase [Gemmatimonadota bacterium]
MTAATTAAMAAMVAELGEILSGWTGSNGDSSAASRLGDDSAFDRLAMRVHEAQRDANPTLRRYWELVEDQEPTTWAEVPPVPTSAFRDVAIVSGRAERVFRTSGTTGGSERRGEHHVASVALYRAAARPGYRRHLLGQVSSLRLVSLIPRPDRAPDSSLSAMAGFIAAEPEIVDSIWTLDADQGIDVAGVRRAAENGQPVLLLATAFSLVHLLDELGDEHAPLSRGSRLMETGGFKGRVSEVRRGDLYRRAGRSLDLDQSQIVNEYGMTELLSQAYDGVAGKAPPLADRCHRFPPWVRTSALDPATLAPLPNGEPGLLAHFDLANAASVCPILTEDLGCVLPGRGVRLLGRAPGAPPRGCSLPAERFLT